MPAAKTPPPIRRKFRIDQDNLLRTTIKRQAGSLQKAVLEGIMNSIDAGATRVDIILVERENSGYLSRIIINDNGKGFTSKTQIQRVFEIFGLPHQEGDATFGEFRMGRGQLFAFGRNVWHSNKFRMTIDIENEGLGYQLETNAPVQPGCSIEVDLFADNRYSSVYSVRHAIEDFVKYAPVDIYINSSEKPVNKNLTNPDALPDNAEHLPNAIFIADGAASSSYVRFYNYGVFVGSVNPGVIGLSGTVISKRPVKLNYARNDVMDDCPIWKQIKQELQSLEVSDVNLKKDIEVMDYVHLPKLRSKLSRKEFNRLRFLKDVNGEFWSLNKVMKVFKQGYNGFHYTSTCGSSTRQTGDSIMQRGLAFVFDSNALESLERVFDWKEGLYPNEIDFDSLAESVRTNYELLKAADLATKDRHVLKALQFSLDRITRLGFDQGALPDSKSRQLVFGDSAGSALGWTDGVNYIAIERRWFWEQVKSFAGRIRILHVLIHEACHQERTDQTHFHTREFYHDFHELCDAAAEVMEHAKVSVKGWIMGIKDVEEGITK